jgi:predicted transcriptional regulator of viral defense system
LHNGARNGLFGRKIFTDFFGFFSFKATMVPKIYKQFYTQRVVTLDEIKPLFPDEQQARNAVAYLIKNGYAKRVKSGLYYLIPFEHRGTKWQPDVLVVGSKISKEYYYSHATAMTLFGILPVPPPRIAITVPQRFRKFTFNQYSYYPVETRHFFGLRDLDYKGISVKVSDMERTFIDCLSRLDLSGGVVGAFRNLSMLGFINYPLLMDYLDRIGKKSAMIRCGFALEFFRNSWEVDPTVIAELRKRAQNSPVYYLDRGIPKGTGKLVKGWNLIIPAAFEDLVGGVGSLP